MKYNKIISLERVIFRLLECLKTQLLIIIIISTLNLYSAKIKVLYVYKLFFTNNNNDDDSTIN